MTPMQEDIRIEPLPETLEVLDISDHEYFGSEYADCVSNSRLSLINPDQGGSWEKYKAGFKDTWNEALHFGSCLHKLVLQPDKFQLSGLERPPGKKGYMADYIYFLNSEDPDVYLWAAKKAGCRVTARSRDRFIKDVMPYWAAREAEDRNMRFDGPKKELLHLGKKDLERMRACLAAIAADRELEALLEEGRNEVTLVMGANAVFADGFVLPMRLKAKVDNWTEEYGMATCNDLKTTGHDVSLFDASFEKFHYYRQMGMYGWLLSFTGPMMQFANMLVVSTVPPYGTLVRKVSEEEMERGRDEMFSLLKLVAWNERQHNGQ